MVYLKFIDANSCKCRTHPSTENRECWIKGNNMHEDFILPKFNQPGVVKQPNKEFLVSDLKFLINNNKNKK